MTVPPFGPLMPYVNGQPVPVPPAAPARHAGPGMPNAPTPPTAPAAPSPRRDARQAPQPTPAVRQSDDPLSLFVDRQKEAEIAAKGALDIIARPLDAFLWWPWLALHQLTNSIPPEELWIIAGMSGAGKTTLMMSLADLWTDMGVHVAYVGLEMRARQLLVHWACRRLARRGIMLHPGDVLKGKLNAKHPDCLPGAEILAEALREEIRHYHRDVYEQLRFVPVKWLTAGNMQRIAEQCAAWGVSAIIVDHIDHMDTEEGAGRSEYDQHQALLKVLHHATREYGVTILGGAQMNTEALRRPGALVRSYTRPTTDMVQFGMLKRRICDIQLILHRMLPQVPERADDVDDYNAAMRLIRDNPAQLERYLVPNTMSVLLDKDRAYGHDGRSAQLGVYASRVVDCDPVAQEVAMRRLLSLSRPNGGGAIPLQAPQRAAGVVGSIPQHHLPPLSTPIQGDWLDD